MGLYLVPLRVANSIEASVHVSCKVDHAGPDSGRSHAVDQ